MRWPRVPLKESGVRGAGLCAAEARLLRAGIRPSRVRQCMGRLLTLCKTLNHSLRAAAASIENITSSASGNQ